MKFRRALVVCMVAAVMIACGEERTVATTPPAAAAPVVQERPMPVAPKVVELNPAKNVDENLFLLRMLEEHYRNVPDEEAGDEEIDAWLAEMRAKAQWARALIGKRKLDGHLDELYEDFLGFADAYVAYRKKVGTKKKGQRDGDLVSVGIDLFEDLRRGEPTYRSAGQLATIVEDVTRDVKNPFDVINRIARHVQSQSTKSEELEKERIAFEKLGSTVKRRAQTTARILTDLHRWRGGESGFDFFESDDLEDYIRRRPRDPFARSHFANREEEGETYLEILRDAELCREAAELVPMGREYDSIRQDFFAEAASLALVAAREQTASGFSAIPASASWAVAYARGYLELDRRDASGRGHVYLTYALAYSGRYAEALTASKAALDRDDRLGNNGSFCAAQAALRSLEGSALDQVETWILQAYDRGYTPTRWLRESPDFANFKRAYPEEFQLLTTPDLRPRLVLDEKADVLLHNASKFRMTNVRVEVTVREGEDNRWSTTVWCDSIPKGETCTHENVLTITEDRFDVLSIRYVCDQCRAPIARSVNSTQNERMGF